MRHLHLLPFATAALLALAALLLAAPPIEGAVPIPGPPQEHPIALVGGTIHTMRGPAFRGTVVFDRGRIVSLGDSGAALVPGIERIDVTGKEVYPTLVDACTRLGLTEIDAVRATRDYDETGSITPEVRAEVAVNPESELIPVTRSNGVLAALTAPTGGLISGTSAFLLLDGWTWQDMTLRAPVALHVNWPAMAIARSAAVPDSARKRQVEERDKALREIRKAFEDARAYMKERKASGSGAPPHEHDQRWEAMIPALEGRIPVIVRADEAQQIEAAVAFGAEQKLRVAIYGGYDAPRCADLLRKFDVPVIVSATHRMPLRRFDSYDDPFTLPERLRAAAIRFCIANGGGSWNERNLPYQAATAVAYGLPRDEALRAITLSPAEILGVADRLGSLAEGRDATLIVTNGDPLETTTQVERAYIQGRAVDLLDRQKVLYVKYRVKYQLRHGRP